MQIVDSNDFNVRTAVYLLEKEKLEFLIIPVFHVGSKEFYDEVTKELDKCDVILFEGIGLKGMGGLWRGYKRFAKRLGLRYQNDQLNMKKYGSRLVHADFAGEKAESEWKKIPIIARLIFKIVYPIGYIIFSFRETKRSFAKSLRNRDVLDDQFWFMRYGKSNSVDSFLIEKRDQVILEEIEKQIKLSDETNKRIGIIYGAAHMQKVIDHLMETHRFLIKDSWFLTVFWMTRRKFRFRRREGG